MENTDKFEKIKSAEVLRLIISKIAEHPAAFTPETYAVWYEFITAINPLLNDSVLRLINTGYKLDNATIKKLYDKHISKCMACAENNNVKLKNEIVSLFSNLMIDTEETTKLTDRFSTDLTTYDERLQTISTIVDLQNLIVTMTLETNATKTLAKNLHKKLLDSKLHITELRKELKSARVEANIDPLTKLLNRRGLDLAVADIDISKLCILLIDIDRFKQINDDYGHLFGDDVIKKIADIFTSKIRKNDISARLGGDEFMIILPTIDINLAYKLAEDIRHTIELMTVPHNTYKKIVNNITVSIGVVISSTSMDIFKLIDKADKSLYISKNTGRNKTTIYNLDLKE